jgi:Fur family ferric uptake transcriptional regulator
VLDLLSDKPGHWSAKDIHASLRLDGPGIGLMTVYRTLDLLERTGVVHRIALADGQARYELRSTAKRDHHHHLICTVCGRIVDYSDFVSEELDLVRKTEESLARKHGFRILDHNIEFLGLCAKCRNEKEDRCG